MEKISERKSPYEMNYKMVSNSLHFGVINLYEIFVYIVKCDFGQFEIQTAIQYI